MRDVFVTGRFPPPVDGQALATARLATILEPHYPVRRFNTMPAQQDLLPTGWRQGLQTTRHYLHQRSGMRRALAGSPAAAVLWCAISPSVAGHFRDILTSVPCFRGHPVCAVVHRGNFDRLFTRKATLPTARRLANRINLFVFLSQSQAESVADWIPAAKLRVVPNTIDAASLCTPAETARKQRSKQDRQELRLLFLSNMIPSKGYLHVLEAIAIARKRGRAVTGTFAGRWNRDGDRHAFLRRVQALKLDDAVTHLGPVTDRAAVKALHLGADVLALPTFYENEAQPPGADRSALRGNARNRDTVRLHWRNGAWRQGSLIRAAPVALRYCRRHRPAVFGGTVVRSFQPGAGPLRGEILCGSRLRKMASHCGRACPGATLAHPSQGYALGRTRGQQCYRLGRAWRVHGTGTTSA